MKILLNPLRSTRGSTLLVTAFLAIIAGSTLAYFLVGAQQELSNVNRSRAWNSALVLAEAGIEEGMTLVNNGGWPDSTSYSSDGWTRSGNVYSITRVMDDKIGSYTVSVTASSSGPSIRSVGTAYARDASYNSNNVKRAVLVRAMNTSPFPGALTMQKDVDMNGNNVTVDSYDSTDPYHSYWPNYPNGRGYGTYVNTGSSYNAIRNDNGDVATDGAVSGIIDIGNAQVYGRVSTGPGGSVILGAKGSVGDVNWVPTVGIQPGYVQSDMNVAFPDVTLPATNWVSLQNNQNIASSGAYTMDQINGNMTISGSNVVLYVPNGIVMNGKDTLTIGTNAKVTMYVGNTITDGGNGKINNSSEHATQLTIYGLPSLTSIKLNGNGAFWGAVYAPNARVQFKGGGNSGGFYGSLTAYDIVMTGNSTFSYDEALGKMGSNGFTIASWEEVPY
jgi:filamentous hemagglutinin family protein